MKSHSYASILTILAAAAAVVACGKADDSSSANALSTKTTKEEQLSCVYDDPSESTRFEFRFVENASEGTLNYKYSPVGDAAIVEGSFKVKLAVAGWNMNIYQGGDARASARLNAPRPVRNGAVRLELNVVVNGKTLEPRQFLECKQQR